MKERRETLCRLVQVPRAKVKTSLKTYPRRIFKEARDAGGGAILPDPLPIGKENASVSEAGRARRNRGECTLRWGKALHGPGKRRISRRGDRGGP